MANEIDWIPVLKTFDLMQACSEVFQELCHLNRIIPKANGRTPTWIQWMEMYRCYSQTQIHELASARTANGHRPVIDEFEDSIKAWLQVLIQLMSGEFGQIFSYETVRHIIRQMEQFGYARDLNPPLNMNILSTRWMFDRVHFNDITGRIYNLETNENV